MESQGIYDVHAVDGGVFIDNLLIASADRLLAGKYDSLEKNIYMKETSIANAIFHHDIFNLAVLVESIVCHDMLYTNNDFVNIWNGDIYNSTLVHLDNILERVWEPLARNHTWNFSMLIACFSCVAWTEIVHHALDCAEIDP